MKDSRGFMVCAAQLYLDGHKMSWNQMGIDEIVNVMDLAAVEVYRGPGGMAPEFIDSSSGCGAIVLWTKYGPGPPR